MTSITPETEFLKSFSDALVSVIKVASESVVKVTSVRGVGSGIVRDQAGLIPTNAHVIGGVRKNRSWICRR